MQSSWSQERLLGVSQGVLISFCARWCIHCRNLEPAWYTLTETGNSNFIKINCDELQDLSTFLNIFAYPTIRYYPPNGFENNDYIEYNGDRSVNSMAQFYNKYNDQTVLTIAIQSKNIDRVKSIIYIYKELFSHIEIVPIIN